MYRGLTSSYQRGGSWGWVRRVNELSKEKKKKLMDVDNSMVIIKERRGGSKG